MSVLYQTNNCCYHYNEELNNFFFLDLVKLVIYLLSAVILTSSNPCVGPSQGTFFLILVSAFIEKRVPPPKVIIFSPNSLFI